MGVVQQTKIVFKSVGDPKKALALMPENENKAVLGTIMGIATKEITRKGSDGVTIMPGLGGSFEAMSVDPTKDTVQSGVCFMPEAFQGPILDILRSDENAQVKFAAEISIVRATNPQGYSWQCESLLPPAATDPLTEMRAQIAANKAERQKQLEAPKTEAASPKKK